MSVRQMSIVWELDLDELEQAVLLVLADHADDDGRHSRPSVPRIVWKTGIGKRTVQRILKSFVERGFLVVARKGGGRLATEYRLELDAAPRKMSFDEWKRLSEEEQRRIRQNTRARRQDDQPNEGCHSDTSQNRGKAAEGCHRDTAAVTPRSHGSSDTQESPQPSLTTLEPSLPPTAVAVTPAGGDSGGSDRPAEASESEPRPATLPDDWPRLEEEAAREWMAEIADAHPYLLMFSGSRRRAVRASLTSLIEARVPHVWTDATGNRVPWRIRPAAWELALGIAAREGGRLENIIRLVALPQLLDPFQVRKSSDGSGAGAGAAAEGVLSKVDLPTNLSADAAKRIRDWVAANPEEAAQIVEEGFVHPKYGGAARVESDRRVRAGHWAVIEITRRARELESSAA